MGLFTIGGKLYAVGGRFNTYEYNTNLLDVCDPAKNTWSSLKSMLSARSGSAVAVLDGKIFVFGGERLGGTFNQAEAYDPVADVWAELAAMPMSAHGTGAVTIGEAIYIPAGGTLNGGMAQTNGPVVHTELGWASEAGKGELKDGQERPTKLWPHFRPRRTVERVSDRSITSGELRSLSLRRFKDNGVAVSVSASDHGMSSKGTGSV